MVLQGLSGLGQDMADNFGGLRFWSFRRLFGWVRTWLMVLVVWDFGPSGGCLALVRTWLTVWHFWSFRRLFGFDQDMADGLVLQEAV